MRDNPNGYRIRLERRRLIYRVDDTAQVVLIAAVRFKRGPETYTGAPWN